MNIMEAFARGAASRGKRMMVFDWDKAAQIIADRKPEEASAGLRGDWEYTGGVIFENGKPSTEHYTYLASTWAAPQLDVDDDIMECWCYRDDWDSKTKWPESALAIIEAAK